MYNQLKYILKILIYKIRSINYKMKYYNNKCEKIIVFQSFHGTKYNDSPKSIFLEMLEDEAFSDYTFYWAFKEIENFPIYDSRVKTVKYNSMEYFQTISKAKFIITSTRLLNFIHLKKEQIYVQTWHGTPLKKLGIDITSTNNKRTSIKDYQLMNNLDSYKINYFISPSAYASSKFKSAFGLTDKQILEIGYPRNDYLTNYNTRDVTTIKESLNIESEKKVILYAPTWRDDNYSLVNGYTDNKPISIEELSQNLNNSVILYRSHYMSKTTESFENVIDVSNYNDINDLFIISDLLITDYSSVFFDYAILKKPCIFYMYDLERYENHTRGFYFDIQSTLYGPIVQTKKGLIEAINNPVLQDNFDSFYVQFCKLEDGMATKRLVGKLKSEISK